MTVRVRIAALRTKVSFPLSVCADKGLSCKANVFREAAIQFRHGETFAALREICLATASANQKPILSLFGTIKGDN